MMADDGAGRKKCRVAFQNRSAPLPTHSGRSCRSRLIKSSLSVFQPHCFSLCPARTDMSAGSLGSTLAAV
jgi:hypothetical protein